MKKEIFFLPHGKSRRFACVGRIIIISLILAESFLPYLRSGNLNDDVAERPLFHGAYKVETFVLDNDTIPPLLTDTSRWRSVFIHRYHYLIIQMMDETMHERELVYDTLNKKIQLFDYDERPAGELNYYSLNDSVLELKGNWEHQQIDVSLKKIDLKKLPLIKKEFGWTIDQ